MNGYFVWLFGFEDDFGDGEMYWFFFVIVCDEVGFVWYGFGNGYVDEMEWCVFCEVCVVVVF